MANQAQLEILRQGVDIWNAWRDKNTFAEVDLSEADLTGSNFIGIDLSGANLSNANLSYSNLNKAFLNRANLSGVNLWKSELVQTNFSESNLGDASIYAANLTEANLWATNLEGVSFVKSTLKGAKLQSAFLREANFTEADLSHANLEDAIIENTTFSITALHETQLLKVRHYGPSYIGIHTLKIAKGQIPETFLRGCGLSDWEIESAKLYKPDLSNEEITKIQYRVYDLRATQSIQISPLFISYSHGDKPFVDKIDSALTQKGIRFWRDIHDMQAGKIETQIDRAIRQNPTVLLVLSKNSLNSDWVQHEVRTARNLEKEFGRDALCPIALDDSWKSSRWPERIMEQITEYNILNFSSWENESAFHENFTKLLNGLNLFYKKSEQ